MLFLQSICSNLRPWIPRWKIFCPCWTIILNVGALQLNTEHPFDSWTVHDVPLDPKEANLTMRRPAAASTSHSDDYVWDVFYHRPVTLSEWNEAAHVGTLCVLNAVMSSINWCIHRSGLPPSITDAYASASESEEEDEADEDSNGAFCTFLDFNLTVFL